MTKLRVQQGMGGMVRLHIADWKPCVACRIGRWATNHVFARGRVPCDILFIGEAPGKTEDAVGYPFVGPAGKLLNAWIESSVPPELTFAITNVVCCRPCDERGGPNRPPTRNEVENCNPRLVEFVKHIAQPKGIVLLGSVANDSFTPTCPHIKLYHPAYVLRMGGRQSDVYTSEVKRLEKFIRERIL